MIFFDMFLFLGHDRERDFDGIFFVCLFKQEAEVDMYFCLFKQRANAGLVVQLAWLMVWWKQPHLGC